MVILLPPVVEPALASALPRRRSLRGRPRQGIAVRDLVALRAGLFRAATLQLHPPHLRATNTARCHASTRLRHLLQRLPRVPNSCVHASTEPPCIAGFPPSGSLPCIHAPAPTLLRHARATRSVRPHHQPSLLSAPLPNRRATSIALRFNSCSPNAREPAPSARLSRRLRSCARLTRVSTRSACLRIRASALPRHASHATSARRAPALLALATRAAPLYFHLTRRNRLRRFAPVRLHACASLRRATSLHGPAPTQCLLCRTEQSSSSYRRRPAELALPAAQAAASGPPAARAPLRPPAASSSPPCPRPAPQRRRLGLPLARAAAPSPRRAVAAPAAPAQRRAAASTCPDGRARLGRAPAAAHPAPAELLRAAHCLLAPCTA
jgi:hypothetical protein